MKQYDAIIIGGGTAGSMTGIGLQKKGNNHFCKTVMK
jgi:2-polyprenyl-6-methoxyphenol hydroxylase-like FAD-dependent oxidoreductase